MNTTRLAAAVLAATLLSAPVLAADGKQLFADKGCAACHGEDAATPLEAGYPRLAGQNPDYAFAQMKDIKAGARANGQSAEVMKPVVDDLAEADMRAIADWLGTLPRAAQAPADHPGKKLFQTKTCVACHGKDGIKPIMKGYPVLAGQDKDYLVRQAKDVQSGARKNGGSNAMQPVMHLTSDEELGLIAAFLANVK